MVPVDIFMNIKPFEDKATQLALLFNKDSSFILTSIRQKRHVLFHGAMLTHVMAVLM